MSKATMPEPLRLRWNKYTGRYDISEDHRSAGDADLITTEQAEAYADARVREALTKLLAACPTTLHCDDFHHTKADQHMDGEYCPPLARYLAAIDHARRVEEQT